MKLYKQIFFKSKSEKIFVLLVSVVINKQQENARVDRQHNFLGGSALRHNECKEHVVQSFQCVKDLWVLHTTWKPLETLGSELNLETGLCTIIFSWKLACTLQFFKQCPTWKHSAFWLALWFKVTEFIITSYCYYKKGVLILKIISSVWFNLQISNCTVIAEKSFELFGFNVINLAECRASWLWW